MWATALEESCQPRRDRRRVATLPLLPLAEPFVGLVRAGGAPATRPERTPR